MFTNTGEDSLKRLSLAMLRPNEATHGRLCVLVMLNVLAFLHQHVSVTPWPAFAIP